MPRLLREKTTASLELRFGSFWIFMCFLGDFSGGISGRTDSALELCGRGFNYCDCVIIRADREPCPEVRA